MSALVLDAVTMSGIIEAVSSAFNAAIGWVGSVASTIAGEPLLLLFCVLPLVGLGVGVPPPTGRED